jgi:hypothetical protein
MIVLRLTTRRTLTRLSCEKFKHRAIIASALLTTLVSYSANSADQEFAAAIGKTGYGRCHMDYCGFFTINAAAPIGSSKDGVLFAISETVWGAQYRPTDDDHEYDHPPISVEKKEPSITAVFCSKTKPTIFDYVPDPTTKLPSWISSPLRPGDENAVFGYNESAYQFYYAACHRYITHDPVSKPMADRLGYHFAGTDLPNDFGQSQNANPVDVLK